MVNIKNLLQKLLILILVMGIGFSVFFILQKRKETKILLQKEQPRANLHLEEEILFEPALLEWQEVIPNASWSGRDSAMVTVFKDKIWLMGGVEGGKIEVGMTIAYGEIPHKSDIWFSENGKDWQLVKERAEWGERRSAGVVVFKDKIWLMGGWTKKFGETKNDVWSSEDGENWEIVSGSAPWDPREGHSLIIFDDKIWLMGGVNYYKRRTMNDVWYSEDGKKWIEATSSAPWSPRWDQTVCVFQNKMWLIGGMDLGRPEKNDVWVSTDGKNWELITENPPWSSRAGHACVIFKEIIWLISGWSKQNGLNDVWYSLDGYEWKKTLKNVSWSGREDYGSFVFKDKIWLIGGMADEGKNRIWKNDVWSSIFKP